MSRFFILLIVIVALAYGADKVAAQDRGQPILIKKLTTPIRLDGNVSDSEWSGVEPFPLVQYEPIYHGELTQRTELRVAYDSNYLYFSCRCFESDPSLIQITSLKRDNFNSGFDLVGIFLDTFNDNENLLGFIVSAAGVRTDATLSNGGETYSASWNTHWDAATIINGEGWGAEGRIPLSSLRFNVEEGLTTMGLTMVRNISRSREMHTFPDIPPNFGQYSWLKTSEAQKVTFEGLTSRRPLYITPYIIGGLGQRFDLDDDETEYERIDDPKLDAGLDLKYGLTNNLTLDVTVNTDFAQVEADDEQVNLTRFSLFFPEKRQFFLERSSNFEFSFGSDDRLFYSRRIGISRGMQVPLIAGARIVGRVGAWDIGALNMQSARSGDVPTENFGVLRLRRQVVNPSSYVGTMMTTRFDADGNSNLAFGGDGIFRVSQDDYLSINLAETVDDSSATLLDAARVRVRWYRNRNSGLIYDFSAARSGKRYNPGIGFQQRFDFSNLNGKIGHGWVPGDDVPIRQHEFSVTSDLYTRNEDQETDTFDLKAGWKGLWRSGVAVGFSYSRQFQDLADDFSLSEKIDISLGQYTNHILTLEYEQPSQWLLRTEINMSVGSFYDGFQSSVDVAPTWNASRFLELGGAYQYDRIHFDKLNETFIAHVGRIRAQVTFTPALSITSFVQISTRSDLAIANFRLRFNPREGNDFYLVYNEGFNFDRPLDVPRIPVSAGRTILLKYAYTFLR